MRQDIMTESRPARNGFISGSNVVISSVFGIGYFPVASATAATFIHAVVMFVFFSRPSVLEIPIVIFLFLFAVKSSGCAEKVLGHDAQEIVIDEVCGFMITLLFIDRTELGVVLTAFLLFRFFDILKPWPIKRSQHISGGLGIVIDDVLAGIYSHLILRLLMALNVL